VPEQSARLRFFVSCEHTEAQIDTTVQALHDASKQV
jgi:8-amino-7-oxononanoate synthase